MYILRKETVIYRGMRTVAMTRVLKMNGHNRASEYGSAVRETTSASRVSLRYWA